MFELKSKFLFELRIPQKQEEMVDIGQTPVSRLMYSVADSGTFAGPKLKGIVIPRSGGDWTRVRTDRSITLDVRICLQTRHGEVILMTYQGLMAANSPQNFRYMIDPTKKDDPKGAQRRFYYRIAAFFETSAERLAWLNRTLAVGTGRLAENQAIYEVFAIE
jgi:hypothetical protein